MDGGFSGLIEKDLLFEYIALLGVHERLLGQLPRVKGLQFQNIPDIRHIVIIGVITGWGCVWSLSRGGRSLGLHVESFPVLGFVILSEKIEFQ